MRLATIHEDIAKAGSVISRVLDVDVFIVDSNLRTVFNTYRYFDRYEKTRPASVVGQVVRTGEVIAIEDKQHFPSCQVCPDFRTCEMVGFVGAPIFYEGSVAGAIALILTRVRVGQIFRDIRNSIAFLENMSALLSSKLKDKDEYTAISRMKQEREVLMDEVREAVASTDAIGCISYHNKRFAEYFGLTQSATGQMITDIVPEQAVESFIRTQSPSPVRDLPIRLRRGEEDLPFHGLMSCTAIDAAAQGGEMLFTFRSLSGVGKDFTVTTDPASKLTFAQSEGLFSQRVLARARRLAQSDDPVLILTGGQASDAVLARCIHNHSSRRQEAFVTLDAADFPGFEEQLLFGEPGRLYMARGGTLFLRHAQRLSGEAGARLADILCSDLAKKLGVRFIFSSSADLKKLAGKSLFSQTLHRFSKHTIRLGLPSGSGAPLSERPIRELEQERIIALLGAGYSKDEIARTLGISRATLYRKIKHYQEKENTHD